MAKSFDFNKVKPKTMSVTLTDEKKTTLLVMTPDKRLKDELSSLYEDIEDADEEDVEEALYELTAKVMSRNKQGIEITSEKLKKLYPDSSYVMAFLDAYVEFIDEIANSKN